jgi:hypothetical protein
MNFEMLKYSALEARSILVCYKLDSYSWKHSVQKLEARLINVLRKLVNPKHFLSFIRSHDIFQTRYIFCFNQGQNTPLHTFISHVSYYHKFDSFYKMVCFWMHRMLTNRVLQTLDSFCSAHKHINPEGQVVP